MASPASYPHAKDVHRSCEAAKVDRARHFFPSRFERSSIRVDEWPEIDMTVKSSRPCSIMRDSAVWRSVCPVDHLASKRLRSRSNS